MQTDQRTILQNSALHSGLTELSNILNDAGLDQRIVLKPEVCIPWTLESTKEQLYKPIAKAMFGKTSTTELTTKEVSEVWDVMMRHLSEKFGVFCDFPSKED